ncbi:universal stress protein [Desulfosporosinus nitroreducens]|uniref:Universal stress protein n=1 Tax=Desulfosporosinus nitroreducens TaxID=2018668 RepID=A0ABT8QR75_9FIRM|nr:universal stress protein [Desulfosporosinus nitroreducens]MCO1603086.1 universal stress protein [Desulfosporosinus nitroreducens]MDO0823857.1 universal stress protein [Desulfosporosinus nitroreducens]
MFNKILLAADGSEHSIRAAEKAIILTQNNPEAKIEIVYVINSEASKADVLRELDTDAITLKRNQKLLPLQEKMKQAKVDFKVKFIHGEPGPALVKYANDGKFDIVVIGSRGLNTLQEFVLGGVSHKVAKRASCPVLIVK